MPARAQIMLVEMFSNPDLAQQLAGDVEQVVTGLYGPLLLRRDVPRPGFCFLDGDVFSRWPLIKPEGARVTRDRPGDAPPRKEAHPGVIPKIPNAQNPVAVRRAGASS